MPGIVRRVSVVRRNRRRLLPSVTALWGLSMAVVLTAGAPFALGQKVIRRPQADAIARQKGWVIRKETLDGGAIELQRIVNGIPLYYATENRTAADSVSTDECWPGGTTGLNLNGAGVTLGVWDGGRVRTTHQEFGGRAVQRDGAATLVAHSSHVSGTMIGAGLSPAGGGYPAGQSKGMSFAASLDCYDFNSDAAEMSSAAGAGLRVSNHSYGLITGWRFDDLGAGVGWYWLGDVNVNTFEDYSFGFYSIESAAWDLIAYHKPYYLIVKSAGNDRNEGPSPGTTHFVSINGSWVSSNATRSRDGNSGYDSISHSSLSKNILCVGAVNDVLGGYAGPGSVSMSSFSSWGPTDDGRIKPDVCGNGVNLYSANSSSNASYTELSGTSMSSPNVAGSMGVLIQHYRATHSGADMRAATLKGLVIHTADESGASAGPDYAFGWGLMDTAAAANVVDLDETETGAMQELVLVDGQTVQQSWTYSGSGPIRVTLSWTDPPGTPPPAALDPVTPMLVNDLDLRVVGPDLTTQFPWRLSGASPSSAATRADNTVDNVEVVDIAAPIAGDYILVITHKGALIDNPQRFSLILTGLTAGPAVNGACCVGEGCAGDMSESDCATASGEWYGAASCGVLACPALGACCEGCAPAATCSSKTEVDCHGVDGRWTGGATCGEVSCALAGDVCASDIQPATDGTYAIDNRCALSDGPATVTCENGSQPFEKDIWYEYVATCDGTLTVSLCDGTGYDAILAIYTDNTSTCPCPINASLQMGAGGDDSCGVGGGPPTLTRDVVAGRCYTIRIGGWDGATGTGAVEIECVPDAIPNDPPTKGNDDVCSGGSNAGLPCALNSDCPGGACGLKNRFVTVELPVTATMHGVRLTIVSLDADSVSTPANYDGTDRWLSAPSLAVADGISPPFNAAKVQCAFLSQDWSAVGRVHICGDAVVPRSVYDVLVCNPQSTCSAALRVSTANYGDVIPPVNVTNFQDVNSIVAKFQGAPSGPSKTRTKLVEPVIPANNVNFQEVSACVSAFQGTLFRQAFPTPPATCP